MAPRGTRPLLQLALVATLARLAVPASSPLPALWPTPSGPSSQTGRGEGVGPASTPSLKWALDLPGGRGAGVAVAGDGTVFVASGGSAVAVSGDTGAVVWNVTLQGVVSGVLALTDSSVVRLGILPLGVAGTYDSARPVPHSAPHPARPLPCLRSLGAGHSTACSPVSLQDASRWVCFPLTGGPIFFRRPHVRISA
jgi:hypothetical protein